MTPPQSARAGSRPANAPYAASARVYDLIYSQKDYAKEARRLNWLLRGAWRPPGRRLLETACGTGRYLEHLRARFDVEGLDLNPAMLAAARERLPAVPLHEGDFRTFDIGERRFDVVACLFSSIGYARGVRDLRRAVRRMVAHLAPGGVLVVEPWISREQYRPNTVHSSLQQAPGLHVARLVTSKRRGRVSVMDMHHVVGTDSDTHHFVERHELWMFTRAEYGDAFERAGLATTFDERGLTGRGLWLGRAG